MTDFPDLKIKALVSFPAAILDGAGVDVVKQNGSYQFNLAYDDFAPPTSGVSDPSHQNVLLWNSITQAYTLTPISLFGGGGGVPEASPGGLQYGRQSNTWTEIVGGVPSSANPVMNGVAAPGVATAYSRGDHVHPSDTSRAPLASPALTGNPTAPTPTAGHNDISIATTAFVTAAITASGGASPSNATPAMDGTAAAGSSVLYSRGDHVHPTDASRAPLASPVFTGNPTSPTPTAGHNDISIATTAFVQAARNGRNLIINGDFRINQREYVSGTAMATPGTYGFDRWKGGAAGFTITFAAGAAGVSITLTGGSSIIQVIENVNVAGSSYVLSWTGTAQGRIGLNSATPSGGYAASPILISGQTPGTVMSVEFAGTGGTLGNVQLEAGTVPTPFEYVNYAIELAKCQRYFEVWSMAGGSSYNNAAQGAAANTNQVYAEYFFQVHKRITPAFAYSALAHFVIAYNGFSAPNALTALAIVYGGPDSVTLVATGTGSILTMKEIAAISANGGGSYTSARLYFDAEL